jgi:EpsI family protein
MTCKSEGEATYTLRWTGTWLTCAVAIAFCLCYGPIVFALATAWATNPVYSYGFAIPLISFYMVRTELQRMPAVRLSPDGLSGCFVTLLGLMMLLLGKAGFIQTVQQVSMVVTIVGLTLLVFGRSVLRRVWVPTVYLLFAVPVWADAMSMLHQPSQLVSTELAVRFLRLAGQNAARQETSVILPSTRLDVVRGCSGVNQLTSILAMVIPAAYLWLDRNRQRVILIVIAVVIGYVSNGARIALVGLLNQYGISGDSATVHVLEGVIVSLLGYGCIAAALCGMRSARVRGREVANRPVRQRGEGTSLTTSAQPAFCVVAIAAMLLVAGSDTLLRASDVPLPRPLLSLPGVIDEWTNQGPGPSPVAETGRHFDEELVRTYRHSSGDQVRLVVGYQRSQHEGKELWSESEAMFEPATIRTAVRLASGALDVERGTRTSSLGRVELFRWFAVGGRFAGDGYRAKAYTIANRLLHRRSDGAVITVEWDCQRPDRCDGGERAAAAFVRALAPLLRGYFVS